MDLTEEMVASMVQQLLGTTIVTYNEQQIDFSRPWKRLSMEGALTEVGGFDLSIADDITRLRDYAQKAGLEGLGQAPRGKIITELFETLCEHKLIQPTFITQYPVEVSPLAKRSKTRPEVTERFELYVSGMELANGFNELNDPADQKERFLQQIAQKEEGATMDEDYVTALEYGLPPTAGEGIGIDRLAMVLTDSPSIREVILFPLLRP
jgi:lysyl-tRNA synthetase class 2